MSDEKKRGNWRQVLWSWGVSFSTFCIHTFAFPPFDLAEFGYLLPIPAALWLFYESPSRKQFMVFVGGAFWLSWLVLLVWLRHVTWIGWIGLATVVALFPVAWGYLTYWLLPRFKDRGSFMRILGISALSGVWVVLEFIRTFLFSGFPWLPLAASQWERPLMLQVASWTGYYGVSFLLLMLGLVIAFYIRHLCRGSQKGWKRICPEFLVGVTIWIFASFGLFQIKFETVERKPFFRAALIQPNIPQSEKWDHSKASDITAEIDRQIRFQKHIGADVAILPEAALPYPLIGDDGMRTWAEKMAKDFEGPVLMGALAAEGETRSDDPWYNGLMILYPESGLEQPYYRKRQRVPFGEYIPFRNVLFFLEKIVPIGGDIFPGRTAAPLKLKLPDGDLPIGSLICYEDIFPNLAVDSVRQGARVLLVVTNDAWYGEEGAAYQHAAHSVLRAVETRRPVVRVGNAGWSGWIDEYGNIRDVLESADGTIYFTGSETVEVTYDPKNFRSLTFYVRYGNWFVAVCAAIVILFFLLIRGRSGSLTEDEEWEQVGSLKIQVPEKTDEGQSLN